MELYSHFPEQSLILAVAQSYFSYHYKMSVFYKAVEWRGRQAADYFHSHAGVLLSCCPLFGSRSDFPETLFFVNIFIIWTDLHRTSNNNLVSEERSEVLGG